MHAPLLTVFVVVTGAFMVGGLLGLCMGALLAINREPLCESCGEELRAMGGAATTAPDADERTSSLTRSGR